MFPSLSRRANSSRACCGVRETETRGKPSCAMLWLTSASAWRTPENVWLMSAGTSVSSPFSGCEGRPSATRASWTSSRACLTAAAAVRSASRRWSKSSRESALRLKRPRARIRSARRARRTPPCSAGPRPGPGAAPPSRRHPRSHLWSFQRRLPAWARMPRTWDRAAISSASAATRAAFLMSTWTWYGSLSSWTSRSPLFTRRLSSTRTRLTWPATRGAT